MLNTSARRRPQRAAQGRGRQGHRRRELHRRPVVPRHAARPDDSLDDPARRGSTPFGSTSTTAGFTVVDYRDIPGANVVALIDDDQPCLAEHEVYHCRRADSAARARRSRTRCSPAQVADRLHAAAGGLRSRAFDSDAFKKIAIDKGAIDERVRRRRRRRRGRVSHRAPGAALHRDQRRDRRARRTAASRSTGRCSVRTTCTGR